MLATLPRSRSAWLDDLVATLGFIQRNYYLTKRYFLWELVWLGLHDRQRDEHWLHRRRDRASWLC